MALDDSDQTRFSFYTVWNHQAPLWVVTILSLIYSIIFLLARLAAKYKSLGLDDVILGLAYLLGLAQWSVVFQALHLGAGKLASTVSLRSIEPARELLFSARILCVIVLGLSKCSVLVFLRQLFTHNNTRIWRTCSAVIIVLGAWTCASALLISVNSSGHCVGDEYESAACQSHLKSETLRWKVVVALDVCLEALLVILPAMLFSTLQMKTNRKVTVTAAFAFRLGVAALFIAHSQAYIHFLNHGQRNISIIGYTVLQQILLAYGLCSASIPCLKNFLGRFGTGDLSRLSDTTTARYGYGSQTASGGRSFALTSLDGNSRSKDRSQRSQFVKIRPESAVHFARAYASKGRDDTSASVQSFGSDQMIIQRRVEVDVVHQ